jgi:hypothetical protein
MSASEPVIRASYAKTVIAGMKRDPSPEREDLLARLNPTLRASIREASLLDWIPARDFSALATLIFEVLGADRSKSFWRANLLSSLERTLLSPLRLGAIALYGESPGSLMRMAPQAWQLVSRHCGKCSPGDMTSVTFSLIFKQLPRELSTPGMMMLWGGGTESCIERMKFNGHADCELSPTDPTTAIVHAAWKSR